MFTGITGYLIFHAICIVPAYVIGRLFHAAFLSDAEPWTKKDQTRCIVFAILASWAKIMLGLLIFALACVPYLFVFIWISGTFFVFLYRCLFKDGVSFASVEWNKKVIW